ncbi:RidA family protein [Pseudohongiella spirulinae]|uniref:Endoribonuclease L-PSP n=1 Tax=Pseudohongiella spirulinae TaxID=1249552 RepID=A0A0S2KDF3_9GAMM|nr:RidA family protein [Pseudohongiella spirulinae]ALO45986.1 Endoribonuclease L-PSP [Pseudohongiella spirulinae]
MAQATLIKRSLLGASLALGLSFGAAQVSAQDVIIHPNAGTFPIANAVEVGPGASIIFHSGVTPAAANPNAQRGTPEFYGDTKTQAISVFERTKANLENLGLSMGDVVKMTVFLVGDPANGGEMDFNGFMEAYRMYWGTEEQPRLPARSTVEVARLVGPLMFVEVEVITATTR